MLNQLKVLTGLAMLALLTCLAGCSDFDEIKSRGMLTRAQTFIKEGDQARGEELLVRLAERYPNTQAGEEARTHLQQQANLRGQKLRQEYLPLIESYAQVFDGFKALFGRYPATLAELDSGGYIFDTDYLVEITPPGFELYLCLTGDQQGYRLWGCKKDAALGFTVSGNESMQLVRFEQLQLQMQAYPTLGRKGPLVLLGGKP